jgi:hypothetical protein
VAIEERYVSAKMGTWALCITLLAGCGEGGNSGTSSSPNGTAGPGPKGGSPYQYSILRGQDAKPIPIKGRDSLSGHLLSSEAKVEWTRLKDKYGRPINRLSSPVMTYAALKKQLGFAHKDVDILKSGEKSGPHLRISRSWLTLDVTFADASKRDGSDDGAKCKGVLTEHLLEPMMRARKERKYQYPSIMEREDDVGDRWGIQDSLRSKLSGQGWVLVHGPRGRLWKWASPELTYGQLQKQAHFHDEDLTQAPKPVKGKPDAFIKTPTYTLEIRYEGDKYDGKDKSVKLKAVLINNKAEKEIRARWGKKIPKTVWNED